MSGIGFFGNTYNYPSEQDDPKLVWKQLEILAQQGAPPQRRQRVNPFQRLQRPAKELQEKERHIQLYCDERNKGGQAQPSSTSAPHSKRADGSLASFHHLSGGEKGPFTSASRTDGGRLSGEPNDIKWSRATTRVRHLIRTIKIWGASN